MLTCPWLTYLVHWQVERERSLKSKALLEKEEYRAHIHKLARALKRHQVCHSVELIAKCPIYRSTSVSCSLCPDVVPTCPNRTCRFFSGRRLSCALYGAVVDISVAVLSTMGNRVSAEIILAGISDVSHTHLVTYLERGERLGARL